jgi:manganese/iron transport system substrate-binding protein
MVTVIQQSLGASHPTSAPLYAQKAQSLTREVGQMPRTLITTHDALGYYAAAYDIPVEGALQGMSTETKPSACGKSSPRYKLSECRQFLQS